MQQQNFIPCVTGPRRFFVGGLGGVDAGITDTLKTIGTASGRSLRAPSAR